MTVVETEGERELIYKDVPDRDGILTPDRSRIRLLGVGSTHDPSLSISTSSHDSAERDIHPA